MADLNHARKKGNAKKKKERVAEAFSATESSEEELDLTKDCHPIAHYMDDRAEMINQMFSVIKGNKLRAMLPPILKDSDLEQIKLECLDELLGMSEKRITSILEGEILESSSESDIGSDDADSSDDSSASLDVPSDRDSSDRSSKWKRAKRKSDTESVGKKSKISRVEEEAAPEQGKTLLEILELEMRARAIRALLKQGGEVANQENNSEELQQSNYIVDLTEGDEEEFPAIVKKEPQSIEQERTFEDKVEKTAEKVNSDNAAIKQQKLIAELELRNKLIKKKSYRTRKQRMENSEDFQNIPEREATQAANNDTFANVCVKEEKETEIVIEDPEEGEVSTEEETDFPMTVKEEKPDSPEPVEEVAKPITGERITAIDDGNFIVNANLEYDGEHKDDSDSIEEVEPKPKGVENILLDAASDDSSIATAAPLDDETMRETQQSEETSEPVAIEREDFEDISWRERWLQRDEIQHVVKSSKICGKAKKNIAKKKLIIKDVVSVTEGTETDSNSLPPTIEGSVTEYNTLMKGIEGPMLSTPISTPDEADSEEKKAMPDQNSSIFQ